MTPARADDHPAVNAPSAGTLPAKDTPEEAAVEREWINPANGRRYRVGNATDAGRICGITAENPSDIGHQYRRMVRRPFKTFAPPPGPILQADGTPLTELVERTLPPRIADDGRHVPGQTLRHLQALYDLDAVQRWQDSRPGKGRWRPRLGWGHPVGARKAHYFPDEGERSLCGRYERAQLEPGVHLVPDADAAPGGEGECVECRRRLDESRGRHRPAGEQGNPVSDLAQVG